MISSLKKIITYPLIIGSLFLAGCTNPIKQEGKYNKHFILFTQSLDNGCSLYIYSDEKREEYMDAQIDCKTGKPFKINLNQKVSDLEQFANSQEIESIFNSLKLKE